MRFFSTLLPKMLAASVVSISAVACQSAPELADSRGIGAGASVDAVDRKVWFAAADAGDTKILRALLEDGMDALIERQGLTALHIAARHGYLDAATLLVDAGVTVNLVPNPTEAALAATVGHGNPQITKMIVGDELDPEAIARASNIRSPLNLAVENGHADVAAFLIGAGADVNARGEWYCPLHSAVLYGDAGVVALLLDNGARTSTKIRIHDRASFSGFRYVGPVELARTIERDDLVDLLQHYGGRD
jgi:hypothetical protein